jgi:hypothetical protein
MVYIIFGMLLIWIVICLVLTVTAARHARRQAPALMSPAPVVAETHPTPLAATDPTPSLAP